MPQARKESGRDWSKGKMKTGNQVIEEMTTNFIFNEDGWDCTST